MLKEEEAQLKLRLTPERFNVCVNKGTEIRSQENVAVDTKRVSISVLSAEPSPRLGR
jgi:hypothetical protein